MLKGKRIPPWLVRRSYFKRIERWVKPGKPGPAAASPEAGPAPMASNVVPFPVRTNRPDRTALDGLRGLNMA